VEQNQQPVRQAKRAVEQDQQAVGEGVAT
jgi:hypothetical protein